ncbi:MAG: hypothetical protein LBU48_04875 [Coriobacteriales bacterium]|jgi:glutamate--cysteine ligase|nr:hypothetical protein [Coriobacteriales bacterium]
MESLRGETIQVQALTDYLSSGIVSGEKRSLGLELEHFVVERGTGAPVSYLPDPTTGRPGIRTVLERLAPAYDERVFEPQGSQSSLIGLIRPQANITLEPGAQLEISIGPASAIAELEALYAAFRADLDPILADFGYELLHLGYHPTACASELPLIPKNRYEHMDRYFESTGRHGICMMRATASTQVSIDYFCEKDAVQKFRVANALGPLLAFVTDNSPFFEGVRVGSTELTRSGLPVPRRMARTVIWDDVDAQRSMTAPCTFDEGFGFVRYAESLLDAPAIFSYNTEGLSVYEGFTPFKEVFANTPLSAHDIEHILSLFFFDARLKTYIEIRVADSLPLELALGFTALVKGIFYNQEALDSFLQDFQGLDASAIAAAKRSLRNDGYAATVYERPATQWLDRMVEFAWAGLPPDEQHYLKPLASLIARRATPLDSPASH